MQKYLKNKIRNSGKIRKKSRKLKIRFLLILPRIYLNNFIFRTESINISGSLFRNRVKFSEFLNKWMNHNPKRGFVHYRAPSRIIWRTIRGMMPFKTPRGAAALGKTFFRIKKGIMYFVIIISRIF